MLCDGTGIDTVGRSSAKLNSVVVGLAGPVWTERESKNSDIVGQNERHSAGFGCSSDMSQVVAKQPGDVAQLVRALPCHGRGRGFEPRRPRHKPIGIHGLRLQIVALLHPEG
jgi:hypothetical protein